MITGRPVNTSSGRIAIRIATDVKMDAAILAMRRGWTLSMLVERLLREHLAAVKS